MYAHSAYVRHAAPFTGELSRQFVSIHVPASSHCKHTLVVHTWFTPTHLGFYPQQYKMDVLHNFTLIPTQLCFWKQFVFLGRHNLAVFNTSLH
jgi:hypothetical protein